MTIIIIIPLFSVLIYGGIELWKEREDIKQTFCDAFSAFED